MRLLILASALALTLVLTGCQTPHAFSTPDATWQAHVGQLKFSNRKRTLIGDVVVQQRGDKDFQLDFIKGGGLPLLSLRQDASTSRVEGLLAHHSWQGAPEAAPRPLQPWLKLRQSFAHPPTANRGDQLTMSFLSFPESFAHRPPAKSAHGEAKFSGGQLTMLFLAFPDDDQRFVFQFNR